MTLAEAEHANYAAAKAKIAQSPLSKAGQDVDVPAGTVGSVEDVTDGLVWVDFGEPYGVVCCYADELEAR